jgi:dTDP-4-dehydrorhamnose reductase
MHPRILLTGSNGLLGQKIVPLLLSRSDVTFLATARGDNRHPLQATLAFQSLDLTDPAAVSAAFASFRPTVVINTAAQTQVDYCETHREACDAVNVYAVDHLAQCCAQHGARLVHISTDFVFDGRSGPYREADMPQPVNYYGQSKLRGEQAIEASGAPYAILRTILLYGVTPAMSRSNIVLWAKKTLEAGQPIKAVNDQWRCPTLAEDLAEATVQAALRGAEGLFHIGGPDLLRIDELLRRIADFWQLDTSLISEIDSASLSQKAQRPGRTGLVIDKARAELGYQPHDLAAGLALVDQQLQALTAQ